MQHRAAVRACQAQRQKSECYRKKRTKSASISQKNRLQHDAAYQKCHQVVCYNNQIKRLHAIFKEKNKDAARARSTRLSGDDSKKLYKAQWMHVKRRPIAPPQKKTDQ